MPKVSINIITRNRAPLLKEALLSVLNQTYKDFEIIIIDDDSDDGTEKMIKDWNNEKIVYEKVSKQNEIAKLRNMALKKSTGKYIAILDDDDLWVDEDKIKNQVNFLEKNENYVLVGTNAIIINNTGTEIYRISQPIEDHEIRKNILGKCPFVQSSVLYRNNVVQKIGGYNTSLKSKNVEDYRLWLDMGKEGMLKNLESYSIKYRETATQLSKLYTKEQTAQTVYLSRKYKNFYPNFIKSYIRAILRHIIYGKLKMKFLYYSSSWLKKLLFR